MASPVRTFTNLLLLLSIFISSFDSNALVRARAIAVPGNADNVDQTIAIKRVDNEVSISEDGPAIVSRDAESSNDELQVTIYVDVEVRYAQRISTQQTFES